MTPLFTNKWIQALIALALAFLLLHLFHLGFSADEHGVRIERTGSR